jgi:hypothetical protein
MTGTVYILQVDGGGPIKIGFTTQNVYQRITSIQHGSPYVLNWVGAYRGTIEDERSAHRELSDFNLRGEWFHPVAPVLKFIESKSGVDFTPTAYLNKHCGMQQRNEIRARLAVLNRSFHDLSAHGAPCLLGWFLYLAPVSETTIAKAFAALEHLETLGRRKRRYGPSHFIAKQQEPAQ